MFTSILKMEIYFGTIIFLSHFMYFKTDKLTSFSGIKALGPLVKG